MGVCACKETIKSLSHGDSLTLHHMVFPSSLRFFGAYQRPRSDSDNQMELNGKVSML